MSFQYSGRIPASKSLLNRLLVIQSFARENPLLIRGDSSCDDVVAMRRALPIALAAKGEPADCGAAGTTFRFLALRASRIAGRHLLTGTPALLARPQKALVETLIQLGVRAELTSAGLVIESQGWKPPRDGRLLVDRSQSSQFASAMVLSAWELDFELSLQMADGPSEGYFAMTEELVRQAGMRLERSPTGEVVVERASRVTARELMAESDLSSCFAVSALATVSGSSASARFLDFPQASLQPDRVFLSILAKMGVEARRDEDGALSIRGANKLRAVDADLRESPDLFPVLAVLCAFAQGTSRLYGAPHLAFKESSRIEKTAELLRGLGREIEVLPDGMVIHGNQQASGRGTWDFDPSDDHRLAMAAAVARQAGEPVRILHPEVVAKSFPEFWAIAHGGGR